MNPRELEQVAIEKLSSDYAANGYEIVSEPQKFFVHGYTPDLVVRKDGKTTLVEVKGRKLPSIKKNLEKLKSEIEANTEFTFDFHFIGDLKLPEGLPIQSNDAVQTAVDEAKQLLATKHSLRAAYLLGWAAFEAASRAMLPDDFKSPQSPGRLVTILASRGYLTPSETDVMRDRIAKRNMLIHGSLEIDVQPSDVNELLSLVEELQQTRPATIGQG